MSAGNGPGAIGLVLGATGDQGRPQVAALAAAGFTVRAAVRDPLRAGGAFSPPIESVVVDFAVPASLARACAGVDVVLANFPSSSFNDGSWLVGAAEDLGLAARQAGVRRIVFNTSLPQRDRLLGHPGHDVRFRMREAFIASGVPTVTLCPVVYADNLLRGWAFPHIADRDTFVYPHAPDLEVSWLCQDDLAALMVAAAQAPGLEGRVLQIGGPEILRGADVAERLSAASGRAIRFVSQPVEEFAEAMRPLVRHGTTEERDARIRDLARIYQWYNTSPERPFRVDMAPVLADLQVRLTPMAAWAARQRWSR